jgi:hypothetical protein
MIVKIMSRGRSFKGVANYVLHDPKEKTSERVGFIHTRNLALDDALSAVNEMYLTANYAEQAYAPVVATSPSSISA